MLCQQSSPFWDLQCITHQHMSACGLSLLQHIHRLLLNNGKCIHTSPRTDFHTSRAHTRGRKTNHCSEEVSPKADSQRSGRETHIQGESERQEGPYIVHRKSCVRTGSSLFGHGGFLLDSKTDISSTVGL